MAKYGKKTKFDGITFDSETECEFYKLLKKAKKDKLILELLVYTLEMPKKIGF